MPATLIDGSSLAAQTKDRVRQRAAELAAGGRRVSLTAVLVGSTAAGELYAQRQAEACTDVGIQYFLKTLPANSTAAEVSDLLQNLNQDSNITGIMLHLPLPPHLDATELQYRIDPVKDVEGVNPANIGYVVYGHTLIAPCTAQAVIELIESTGVPLRGAEAVVVGASEIAGKPIALLLTERMATVTLCHIATRDLEFHTRRAEVLVVAVGKAGLITADHVRPGAIVIDVGINRISQPDGTRKTVGDVDFLPVREKAGYITPVPGGVGPMTVAMLLKNTIRSAPSSPAPERKIGMQNKSRIPLILLIASSIGCLAIVGWYFFQSQLPPRTALSLTEQNLQILSLPLPDARIIAQNQPGNAGDVYLFAAKIFDDQRINRKIRGESQH